MSNSNNDPKFGNWKWGNASNNAFQLVGSFFGINPQNYINIKDGDTKKLLQQADLSNVQVKRTQDAVQATKKLWGNQAKIGAMVHGLIRTGMNHILTQRQQESQTAKQYAKTVTKTSVLSEKTRTAIEKTYLQGASQIRQSQEQLNLASTEISQQEQVSLQSAKTLHQERLGTMRDKAQKRLEARKRPWRS